MPFKTKVKIEVFNSEGELVETLVDKVLKGGTYEIEFTAKDISVLGRNAGKLPEGIYIYTMQTVNNTTKAYFVYKKKLNYIET